MKTMLEELGEKHQRYVAANGHSPKVFLDLKEEGSREFVLRSVGPDYIQVSIDDEGDPVLIDREQIKTIQFSKSRRR